MKHFMTVLFAVTISLAVVAQTSPKSASHEPAGRPVPSPAPWVRLPPGVPPSRALVKTAFSLRYQDIRIGTGPEAEPNKIYKVNYTGWLAANGHKFDSSYDHKMPIMGKDGKPDLDSDGKPKMSNGEPISFPQGFGRVIPGFDQGFTGMHVGGKRRLFIPWQLAYGARGRPGPDAANPGIPPKADLIFDIELVDQADLQIPQGHPAMGQPMHAVPPPQSGSPAGAPPAGNPPSGEKPVPPPAEKPQ